MRQNEKCLCDMSRKYQRHSCNDADHISHQCLHFRWIYSNTKFGAVSNRLAGKFIGLEQTDRYATEVITLFDQRLKGLASWQKRGLSRAKSKVSKVVHHRCFYLPRQPWR